MKNYKTTSNGSGRDCCDMVTSENAPGAPGKDGGDTTTFQKSMSSPAGSPARISPSPGKARVFGLARALVFGSSSPVLLASYDRASCSWKTSQLSLPGMEQSSLDRLPSWGMTRSGGLYERPTPARLISGSGGSAWPSPKSRNAQPSGLEADKRRWEMYSTIDLNNAVLLWPTPAARDWKSGKASEDTLAKNSRPLNEVVENWPTPQAQDGGRGFDYNTARRKAAGLDRTSGGKIGDSLKHEPALLPDIEANGGTGQLNPDWVETLMGYPPGWTDSDAPAPTHEERGAWLESSYDRWPTGPGQPQHVWEPPRVASGIPQRTHRLKALGNAVVPQVVYPLAVAIREWLQARDAGESEGAMKQEAA